MEPRSHCSTPVHGTRWRRQWPAGARRAAHICPLHRQSTCSNAPARRSTPEPFSSAAACDAQQARVVGAAVLMLVRARSARACVQERCVVTRGSGRNGQERTSAHLWQLVQPGLPAQVTSAHALLARLATLQRPLLGTRLESAAHLWLVVVALTSSTIAASRERCGRSRRRRRAREPRNSSR